MPASALTSPSRSSRAASSIRSAMSAGWSGWTRLRAVSSSPASTASRTLSTNSGRSRSSSSIAPLAVSGAAAIGSLSLIRATLRLDPVRSSYGPRCSGASSRAHLNAPRPLHLMELPMADADRLTLSLSTGGDVVIKLRPDLAPGHVQRITELANSGFYDDVAFHRVIPGFMAQGGDPTGTGYHGSDLPNLKAEFSEAPHKRGAVSMARSQNPDSAN